MGKNVLTLLHFTLTVETVWTRNLRMRKFDKLIWNYMMRMREEHYLLYYLTNYKGKLG